MDKTPGQVAIQAWNECGNQFELKMEHVAAAVIAHVRPQIEAEYRKLYSARFCDCVRMVNNVGNEVLFLCDTHKKHMTHAVAEAQQPEQSFKGAVINALINGCIYSAAHDTDARKAVNDLTAWECQIALDPLVSSDAQALIDKARAVAIEDAAKILETLAVDLNDNKRMIDASNLPPDSTRAAYAREIRALASLHVYRGAAGEGEQKNQRFNHLRALTQR